MHEVSLAERMIQIAVEAATNGGGGRITHVRARVGELSCVDAETLAFAFEIAARGTPAEGSELQIVRVAPRLKCRACGGEFSGELLDPCPTCGAVGCEILEGRDLRVESIDVER